MLKENGNQESIISKIFKKITNNYSLSQSQQQTQEIKMSKNLPYIKGISKKLWHAFLSEKIRCIYNTESTFCNYFVNRNIE